MASKSVEISVSLPAPLYARVEAERKRSRCSRSSIVQKALTEWFATESDARLVRRYQESYRRSPETKREIDAAQASAEEILRAVEW
jgi:Arc/MetJ-type ribon-helix-helix transcriptional regulator